MQKCELLTIFEEYDIVFLPWVPESTTVAMYSRILEGFTIPFTEMLYS